MNGKQYTKQGFTLLELLLVIGVLVIIVAMSRDFYGSYVSGSQLGSSASMLSFDLRNTRDKAMNGQDDRNWGMNFVNGASDYYEIFSTPTDYANPAKTLITTFYLSNGITFSAPSEGNNINIIFNKISGTTTPAGIIINAGLDSKAISVQTQGLIN